MQQNFYSVLLFLVSLSTLCFSNLIVPGQHVIENDKDIFDFIRVELKAAKVIPEVIDDFKPSCLVAPFYGKKQYPVAFGNIFKISQTKEVPSIKIACPYHKETPNLTIALTDPDAPSRDNPKWSEMCHFIGIIPTSDTYGHDLSLPGTELKEVVEYKPPGPPPKTGYHRYVFLLLEGDNTNLTAPEDRQHWGTGKERHGVRDWARKEGLKVVGANFFIEKNKKQ